MNQNSPSDDNLPIQDGSRIEQQLRQMRPRGPQVDFNAIASVASGPARLATSTNRESRFSTSQFVAATAASWILGAIVGGSCIFYSMKPIESQLARDTKTEMVIAEPPAPQPVPIQVVANSPTRSQEETARRAVEEFSVPLLIDFELDSPILNAQLTVRGFSRTPAPQVTERYVTTSSAIADEPANPGQLRTRAQLMKELLSEPSFQIQ